MTAVAPTAGPIGSWLRTTMAISTATASSTDAWTPIASSAIQLRAICAPTARSTSPTTRPRPSRLRSTASPLQKPVVRRRASALSPARSSAAAETASTADHHGSPSGPSSVKEVSAASVPSTARIGTSVVTSVPARGEPEVRRQRREPRGDSQLAVEDAEQAADPRRVEHARRVTVEQAASTQIRHASARTSRARSWSATAQDSSQTGAACSAPTNTSRRPARSTASTATAATGSAIGATRRHCARLAGATSHRPGVGATGPGGCSVAWMLRAYPLTGF